VANCGAVGLLALFADGPKYGYQLRTEFGASRRVV